MIEFTTFLALLAIPGFVGLFDNFVQPDIKKRFSSWLQSFSTRDLGKAIRELNDMFIGVFEYLYNPSKPTFGSWAPIFILSIVIFPFLVIATFLNEYFSFGVELYGVMSIAVLAVLCTYLFVFWLDSHSNFPGYISWLTMITVGIVLASLGFVYYPPLLIGALTYSGLVFFFLYLEVSARSIEGLFSDKVMNPVAAILTSLVAIILVGLAYYRVLPGLWEHLALNGWQETGYVLINVLADMVSLVETYIVLNWARKKPLIWLPIILVIDILLSALIFLSIPLAAGELPTFLAAITFKGPQPWLGILFWSTFATSLLFYLYVLGSIGLGFVYVLVRNTKRLEGVFQITDRPFLSLGMVLGAFVFVGAVVWPFVF